MSRLVKIINNKYVQIEEYRNPNICFNTSEYNDFEDYCTLRETFDPFEIFYENQELTDKRNKLEQQCKNQKEVIDRLKRYINGCLEVSPIEDRSVTDDVLDKEFKYLLKILKEVSE